MIEGLGPQARALLDAARQGLSPDAAAVRRVRARVGLSAAGPTAGGALAGKLGIIGLVGALAAALVAAGIGVYATRGPTAARAPVVELASPSEAPLQAVMREPPAPASSDVDLITIDPPAIAAPPGTPAGISATAVTRPPPAPPRRDEARSRDPEVPEVAEGVAAAAAGLTLAREVELLDLAMAALRRGDAGGALRAVQRHAVETAGHGQLAEDAAAIEIEALCHLHDPTTNAKLEAFDARFPRSAQRSRLDNKCP